MTISAHLPGASVRVQPKIDREARGNSAVDVGPREPEDILEPIAFRTSPTVSRPPASVSSLASTGSETAGAVSATLAGPLGGAGVWTRLVTEPSKNKQDAIDFVSPAVGFYGNGQGRVFKTTDGGSTWEKTLDKPGTYIRALGFIDEKNGFMGNIGPDYFPGVSDTEPLYRTQDGGASWLPVENVMGPKPTGICAIDVQKTPFINAGVLDYRVTVRAAGRVGGPALMMTSRDQGESWTSEDLSAHTAMIMDVKFLDDKTGFIAGASDPNVDQSHARILKTKDGGKTWQNVYESDRPWEVTWKVSFPSKKVGYVTIQNYDPTSEGDRVVAKTTDGGETWTEISLAKDKALQEFGVGFLDEQRGWVGGSQASLGTEDGGKSWTPVAIGPAANKFVITQDSERTSVYVVGRNLDKLDIPRMPSSVG